MGYSGLIYAAIVAAWLAVLVPRWVRRNEEVERARETDAANGVRVLRRRSGPLHTPHHTAREGADGRTIVSAGAEGLDGDDADAGHERRMVRGAAGGDGAAESGLTAAGRTGEPAAHHRVSSAERALRDMDVVYARAASRRRRILTALLLATVGVVVGVYAGAAPAWAPTVSGAALVGFLVAARRAAVRQDARRARLRRRLAREHAAEPAREEEQSPAAGIEEGKRVAVLEAPQQPAAPAEDTWEPVDVPLPTYVTKPKAPKVNRKIDLSRPGSWTSGRLEPSRSFDLPSHRPAAPAASDASADDTTAAGVDESQQTRRRRAVGE